MNEFKISVIMPIHNHHGSEIINAIESIITQDINFEENIEIIIVNTGSIYSTAEKYSLEYHEKYPNNIKYSYEAEESYNIACNNGIKFAEGKYITILDSHDTLRKDSLSNVYEFFEEHYDQTDVVMIPTKYAGKNNKDHPFNLKFKKNKIADLEKYTDYIQLSPLSAFFKKECFENVQFDENIPYIEDTSCINKILLEKRTVGLINKGKYIFKKRNENRDELNYGPNNIKNYLPKCKYHFLELIEYYNKNLGKLPTFIQNTLLYQIKEIIETPDISILSHDEQEELYSKIKEILENIEDNIISRNTMYNLKLKNICFYIKYPDKKIEVFNGEINKKVNQNWILYLAGNRRIDILNNLPIYIDIIDIKQNYLIIDGTIRTLFEENSFEIQAEKRIDGEIVEIFEHNSLNYPYRNKRNLGKLFYQNINFNIKVPINLSEDSEIKLRLKYKDIIIYPKIKFFSYSELSNESYYAQKNNHIIKYDKDNSSFSVSQFNSFKLIELEHENIEYLQQHSKEYSKLTEEKRKDILKFRLKYASLFLQYYNKNIWLFEDTVNFADDNAEALFKYAIQKEDNIEKYFVISKNSQDYERLKKYGNIVEFNSDEHKLLYMFAEKIITSHTTKKLNPFKSVNKFMCGLLNADIYYLKPEPFINDVSNRLNKYNNNLSLISCSSEKEYELLINSENGYDESIIQVLGLPKYDYLEDNNKKQIIFAPSGRPNLKTKIDLKKSDYYWNIINLLNNVHIINYIKKMKYELIFKLDNSLIQFIDEFKSDITTNIKIDTSSTNQELINNSKLLITDYSLLAYDFAYNKKPILYYQLDENPKLDKNNNSDNHTIIFGNVTNNKKVLLDEIMYYINNDFEMKDSYKKLADEFFKYQDQNNCERVYDWLKDN